MEFLLCFLVVCLIAAVVALHLDNAASRVAVHAASTALQAQGLVYEGRLGVLERGGRPIVDLEAEAHEIRNTVPTVATSEVRMREHLASDARERQAPPVSVVATVDTEGDRGGFMPGDLPAVASMLPPAPTITSAPTAEPPPIAPPHKPLIRLLAGARQANPEGAVDLDQRTTRELPKGADDFSDEEPTRVGRLPTPKELELAGVPLVRVTPSARRTVIAFEASHPPLARTKVSAAVPQLDPVETRYQALLAEAREAHLPATHCVGSGGDCWNVADGALCTCECDGCVRAVALRQQAESEVLTVAPLRRGVGA